MRRQFHELVQAYQHRIYNLACYCVGDRDEARDVTQEVLLKLWRNLGRIEPQGAWPWLVRVTRNASIDALRRRGAYRALVEEDPEGEAGRRAPSRTPGPDVAAEASDFQRHLARALRELAEPYRSILVLREIEDLRYDEIARALGMPLNTVKVYLHRGRRMLRRRLREFAGHDAG
jgi:RNA polymerase sigma-70 factor (ECF subfamily)